MLLEAIAINMLFSVGLLILVLHLDRYEKEPIPRVLILLCLSVSATTIFGVVKYYLFGELKLGPFASSFLRAGLLEESFKFGLFLVALTWESYDESFDAIVYLAIIATGFAINENISFYTQATAPDADILAVRLVPSHLLVDIGAAYFVGLGKARAKPVRYFLLGLGIAVALHGTWNYLCSTGLLAWFVFYEFGLTAFACYVVLATIKSSKYRRRQAEVRELVDKTIFLLRHGTRDGTAEERELRAQLERKLEAIGKLLDNCRSLSGKEQNELLDMVEGHFPHPVTEHLDQGGTASDRLDLIIERMSKAAKARFDWIYLLGLFIAMAVATTGAYLLSAWVGSFFISATP